MTDEEIAEEYRREAVAMGLPILKLILKVSYGSFSEKYCGSTAPAPIVSSGRTMRVQFFTDASVQKTGFSAVWTAVPA